MDKNQTLPLLTNGSNAKTIKSDKLGEYLTDILYLSPYKKSGVNLCAFATKGCIPVCLDEAGRGVFDSVQKGRMRKSLFFINDRYEFFERLIKDINKLIKKCEKTNKKPCVRLNGTSDLTWEKIKHNGKTILEYFPQVQFYDYTKNPNRFENLPKNYDLTFSYTEKTPFSFIEKVLKSKKNIAVVFRNNIPNFFRGVRVINGDKHDLRFLDQKGVIVGLTAKGKAKKDTSGFVVDYRNK